MHIFLKVFQMKTGLNKSITENWPVIFEWYSSIIDIFAESHSLLGESCNEKHVLLLENLLFSKLSLSAHWKVENEFDGKIFDKLNKIFGTAGK